MAINRGARASSHPTPSHFMATPSLPPPTHTPTRALPLHLPHKHTLAQGLFGRSSIVRPPVLSLFDRSSDRSWFVRPIVRSFVRSFIQIIFFLSLCCRNSDRSSDRSWFVRPFVQSFDRSSVQIIFFLPLCYRNFDRSFDRS
jgi:hypothetical protein